jgi:phosphonopyruvate decarboxylase
MIEVKKLSGFFKKNKINFFCGVPDSVLKNFSDIFENKNSFQHLIAANEGSAVGIGVGYHLSTKKIPCIYFQNSGLGNAINPLASISHSKVYSIPAFLMIGWRGSPNVEDEPQHSVKGLITKELLNLLQIRYCVLNKDNDLKKLKKLLIYAKKFSRPVACLVERGILLSKTKKKRNTKNKFFKRAFFINELLKQIKPKTKIVATTGYTSRELMQIRDEGNFKKGKDFYMVGGMGHALGVSLGASLKSKEDVICLDGDGSALMHLGSLRTAAFFGKKNLKHIILNNGVHESVGGQTTTSRTIDFKKIASSMGYKSFLQLSKKESIKKTISLFLRSTGPVLMEVCIDTGSIKNLQRPKNLKKIKFFFLKS